MARYVVLRYFTHPTEKIEYITVGITCPMCGKITKLDLSLEKFNRYYNGNELISNIFTELDANQREALISGICPNCWDKLFS